MPPGPRTRLFGFPQRSAGLPQRSANPRLPAIWIVLDFGGIAPASPHFSLSFVESILTGKLDTRKTALGQRPFRYLRKPPDWGHHTICSNLHAKPPGVGTPERRVAAETEHRGRTRSRRNRRSGRCAPTRAETSESYSSRVIECRESTLGLNRSRGSGG